MGNTADKGNDWTLMYWLAAAEEMSTINEFKNRKIWTRLSLRGFCGGGARHLTGTDRKMWRKQLSFKKGTFLLLFLNKKHINCFSPVFFCCSRKSSVLAGKEALQTPVCTFSLQSHWSVFSYKHQFLRYYSHLSVETLFSTVAAWMNNVFYPLLLKQNFLTLKKSNDTEV